MSRGEVTSVRNYKTLIHLEVSGHILSSLSAVTDRVVGAAPFMSHPCQRQLVPMGQLLQQHAVSHTSTLSLA